MNAKSIFVNRQGQVIATLTGIILIILTGILYYNSQTITAREEKKELLRVIANLKMNEIINWKNERLGDAFVLAESPLFVEAVYSWSRSKSNNRLKDLIIKRLVAFKKAFNYENIFITDTAGRVILTVDAGFSSPGQTALKFIKDSIKEKRELYSDFYYCNNHSSIHFDIVTPLINEYGILFAVLVLRVDPDQYIYPLIQSWPTLSKSAETLLVRKVNDNVQFLNRLKYRDNSSLSFSIPLIKKEFAVVNAVYGYDEIFDGKDYRGFDVLADLRKIPDTEWYLITKMDKSEIFSDLYYRQALIIIFMILTFCAFIAIITYSFRYKETIFYKTMYLNEKELAENKEEFRTILYSIGDAVITTDQFGMVKNINKIGEELTGWTESDASGRKLDEVFNIINEDTMTRSETPVSRVLKEGIIIGLENHTILIHKTGKKIPISDSAAPITDESGNIRGVVLVFRDQTSERETQQKLLNSENRFRSALDDMLEGCQIISYDWRYIYCNEASVRCYRLNDLNKCCLKITEIFPDFIQSRIFEDMQKCMQQRISMREEYEFVFSDYSIGYLELSIHPSPEGIFVLTLDITDRKKTEMELLKKSTELESMFSNLINAFVILESVLDEDGKHISFRFADFNSAYSEISGARLTEVKGKDFFDVWPGTDEKLIDVYSKVALTGKSTKFEMYHKPTDGYYICNVYRPTDSIKQVCVIFEDITERKQNEEMIKKGLQEKETLIRELYHRTKNNMQVIYGILSIQAEMSGNEEYKSLIQETNNRIMSMSLVHQMLYKSKNLTQVNLREYITELANLLICSFNVSDDKIVLNLSLEPVTVKIETAIPCGIILNELISNVFKHAFPGEMKGVLFVGLKRENDDILAIDVKDNGIGIRDGFENYKQKSLGLQLITSITEQQLNGTVLFLCEEGLNCSIRFNENLIT